MEGDQSQMMLQGSKSRCNAGSKNGFDTQVRENDSKGSTYATGRAMWRS